MSEFLRSAMGYFNPGQNADGAPGDDNFVGQNVEVNSLKLRVKRLIAEGIFCWVVENITKLVPQ